MVGQTGGKILRILMTPGGQKKEDKKKTEQKAETQPTKENECSLWIRLEGKRETGFELRVDKQISLSSLHTALRSSTSLPSSFSISSKSSLVLKYLDEEGDAVSLITDDELHETLAASVTQNTPLTVFLTTKEAMGGRHVEWPSGIIGYFAVERVYRQCPQHNIINQV